MTASPESEATPALAILNHPPSRLPGPQYLHDLVRRRGTAENAAAIEYLSAGGERLSMSYEDLHRLSDILAGRITTLRQQQPDDDQFVVPVLAPQHPSLYVALLAVLKAGGAFCPLNLDAPPERLKFIFHDVAATIIITTSEFAPAIPHDDSLVVLLLDEQTGQGSSALPRPRMPKTTDLAYVMYTSGSTGTPKGVGISHEAATQSLLAHDRHIPSFSRFLQFAAPTFDVSVFEIFFPLFRGTTLIGCHRSRMLDDLPSVIRTMHIDACELTPSVAGSLLRKRENAPCLRLLLTIGEMLTKPVIDEFGGGDDRPSMLWAMYGPTEATIHCSLQPALGRNASVGNIGVPLDTVSAFVLNIPEDTSTDKTPRVLAVGEVGELAIGGYQLANGYLNRPKTTSLAFVDSPYGLLYRTADKARILGDGTIECLGRIGHGQVKLRGQRIELGEIEHVALRTPGCHSAVATVIEGILVLFCDVDALDNMDTEIQTMCEAWLPSFMVPGDIVALTGFPRLPSGKIDRRQLVTGYSLRREHQAQHIPTFKNAVEQTLCEVAGRILEREIDPSTNLAAAGMDSLVAIKFTTALRLAGFDLSAVDVLRSRSISQLHKLVAHAGEHAAAQPATTAKLVTSFRDDIVNSISVLGNNTHNVETVIPCTPLQSAMLAETTANPQAYCNWLELSVPGKHGIGAIRSWIEEIARRNTVLRTGFVLHEGEFVQILWKDPSAIPISIEDHFNRDFKITTEEEFLHPLHVQILREKDQSHILLQIHHSLFDGWTVDLLLGDMNALSTGCQPELRPQFSDMVNYTQSHTFYEQCNVARSFWAETLAGFQPRVFPILLDAPPDRSHIESQVSNFAFNPRSVRQALQDIECSPQVVFQAALAWLWGSLVGDDDIVTGFVTSGRTAPVTGIERVMGPCIATLPLRTNLSQTRTIKDLLTSIQSLNRSSLSHASLPLADIRKAAGIVPGQSLYDVLFVYQETLYSPPAAEDCIREVGHLDHLETKLLVEIEPKLGHYECRVTYHTDAISDTHITLLIEELQCVARHMLGNFDSDLSSTRTVFPKHLLSVYNLEPRSYTGTPDLALAVESVASRMPDKTALCFANRITERSADMEHLSYREFNSMANKIARLVRSSGCSGGDVVSIIMEKSFLLYAGILGIVKAGCSYLPLLPSTPTARIETILGQAGVKLCLADNSAEPKLSPCLGHQVKNLEQTSLDAIGDTNLGIPADPSRIAVIVYTSGSTGVPKGVCVTQLNVMSNIDTLSRIYPVNEKSKLLQSCSQAFDVSVFEMFFAWTQGMCLCSATNDTLFGDLERSIRALEVTHLSMTPTVASLVNPQNVPKVEFLVTSGEPMTEKVARSWWRQLYQGYGPSETTNICTVKKMGSNDVIQHLGYSFENTSAVVLSQNGIESVPRGCLGELCFGGDQVAQGYLNMSELTSSKFIDHPRFGRLYRSGDIGRMLPDGSLVITGRVDDQVKLRGQRIELNEINAIIRQSNIIADCFTVVVKRDDSSNAQIASFYVIQNQGAPETAVSEVLPVDDLVTRTTTSLYRQLTAKIPNYMVPSYLIPVSKLPLTASGKLNRAWFLEAFHGLDQSHLESAASHIETDEHDGEWTETERMVAHIVSSALTTGGMTINRWTPLASFGLDSISAISLSKQLQKHSGHRIPVSVILQNQCVARLAQALDGQNPNDNRADMSLDIFSTEWVDSTKSTCQFQGKTLEKILPCTPLQEAMLAASASGESYVNRMLFRLYTDPAAMQKYWATMCERHGILRTCFATTDMPRHAFAQLILSGWQPPWLSFDETQGSVDDCVSQHLASCTDPVDSWEPPVSLAIIRQGSHVYLSFICHHALYDGIAIEQLLHEVEQLAESIPLDIPTPIEPFLKAMLAESPGSDEFWVSHLKDFRPPELPRSTITDTEEIGLTHDIYSTHANLALSEISERARKLGYSLLPICQAAWSLVLTAVLGVEDVCFGNVLSCRSVDVDGIERLVAPCFNTVPLRMDLSNVRQNIDLIKAFSALNPDVIQHQFTSLRHIQSLAFPGATQHLFDTLLLLQQPVRSLDHRLWSLERDEGEMDIPLVCEFIPNTQNDILQVQLHYKCSRISKPFVKLISDLLQHSMSACLNYPFSQTLTPSSIPSSIASKLSELSLQRKSQVATEAISGQDEEAWSEVELRIRTLLGRLSSTPEQDIRRNTTIYQLGLDSINAVQIAALLRKEGMAISASDVVEHKTCANLARKALNESGAPSAARLYNLSSFRRQAEFQLGQLEISRDSVDTVLPCTSLQAGMILQFIQSKGHDYFNFIDFQLTQDINLQDLSKAWTDVSETHAILRTGFIPVDDVEFPFAMVQYSRSAVSGIVELVINKTASKWDVEKWRLHTTVEVLDELRSPPWRVVCVDHGGNLPTMHLAIHHALYDAQSLRRILEDLAHVLRGESLTLSPSTEEVVQDIIGQAYTANKEAFWKAQSDRVVINRFPTLLPLRVASTTMVVESMVGSHKLTDIETSLGTSGFTVQAALQAAWTRVLSSYLGESSITFGVVLSGRNTEATQDAIFPCISTLPVISSNDPSNRQLLRSMLECSGHLYQNQHLPLNKIQRWLGYPESRVFDTLLVYQKLASVPHASVPWKVVNDQATLDCPVSIEIEPSMDGTLVLRITCFDHVVPKEHARLLLKQFDAVFSDLALRPDGHEDDLFSRAPQLFSVTPAEEPELYCQEKYLHQFVESQAVKTPGRTALEFVTGFQGVRPLGQTWSYRSLDENGNRVANMLQPFVRTGDIVAVYFDKCPEAFFSILGSLKAGCAFVALDPGSPPSRKQFILEDSRASVLLTSSDLGKSLELSTNIPIITIDPASLSRMDGTPVVLNPELTPQHTCYCLYTSGTTGTPKGCEITHENAVQAMLAFQRLFTGHWDETSKWLQFASFHFDVAVLEQYWSWSVGITLTAAPRDLILEDLAGTISRLNITHIDLTPSLARLIYPEEVPSLTKGVFITGGEQLKQEILDAWGSTGVIYNAYGPTEATIGVTTYSRVPQNGRASNIGKQFVNVGTYVLKPETETPVLRGGIGELCVAGKLVGKGYIGRADLTAERFPTLQRFGQRVYRTGDLVRILHDGCFDFLGRADDQVKLRGQRLELGEINHTIRSGVPTVTDVATLVVRNESQRKDILVSFVATGNDNHQTADLQILDGPQASELSQRVQAACRGKLPGYMVPTYVLVLPFIPLSPNNKAEIRKLKKLFVDLDHNQLISLMKPISDSSLGLNEVGREVLQVLSTIATSPSLEVDSNATIFDFGIDSISVMRLSAALKRAGFTQASPSLLLTHPRLGDLAWQLSTKRSNSGKNHTLAAKQLVQACTHKYRAMVRTELGVDSEVIEYIAPCSALQEGMISRSNMPATEGAYFNTFRYKLSSQVSSVQLRNAWTKLVESCSILRTRFVRTSDGYIQVAIKDAHVPWTELEIPTESELESLVKEQQQSWIERNTVHVNQPLDLILIKAGEGTRVLVVNISHGIYDAISLDIMLDQLRQYYLQLPVTKSAPTYLEALVHGPLRSYADSKDFWVEHLRSTSFQEFPVISTQPSKESLSCSRLVPVVGLESLCRALGVTHQAIIQAVWISVYQQFLASITIGVVISGRSIDLQGSDGVIGPLFNTVAFHASLSPEETWASLIKQCHAFNVSIIPFQHVALRDVQKWCSGGRPLFDTLFSFQRESTKSVGDQLWTLLDSPPNPDFALAFEATLLSDNSLQLQLVTKAGIADMDTLSSLLDQIEVALHAVLTPERQIPLASHHSRDPSWKRTVSHEPQGQKVDTFDWTTTALAMRDEIASLAEVQAESVTATTSLLELGLDSIDLIKLSSRLRKRGVTITTSQLMRAQIIPAMVQNIEQDLPDTVGIHNGTPSIQITSKALRDHLLRVGYDLSQAEDILPVTALQDSMVAEMVQSDFHRYFNHDVLALDPAIDTERLLQAWHQVVSSSPILRTTFLELHSPEFDTAYCQVINKSSPLTLNEITVADENEFSDVMESARRQACEAGGTSDLLQLTLVKIGDVRHFMLSIAHALYDGWSLELLHRDVEAAYYGSYMPRPPYTAYLSHILKASTTESSQFWSSFLAGAHGTLMPKGKHMHGNAKEEVHRIDMGSSIPATEIRDFCRRNAVSVQVLGQACWAAVLATRTKSLDVTFGVVLSGRDTDEAEELLFPTMSTVAVRSVVHGAVSSWLRYMQENMASISSFQHFPLREALKLSEAPRGALFNSLFIQQRVQRPSYEKETPWMVSVCGNSAVEYPVCVEIEVSDDHVLWRAACDSGYLSRKETVKLAHDLDTVLGYLVRSAAEDVVAFDGGEVSICRLPSFVLPEDNFDGRDAVAPDASDEESTWSETESQIRSAISEISGVPISSIAKSHSVYHHGLDSISTIKVSSLLRKRGVPLSVRQILGANSIQEMAIIAQEHTAADGVANGTASLNSTRRDNGSVTDSESKINAYSLSVDVSAILASAGIPESLVEEVLPASAMQVHMLSVWQNTSGAVFYPEFTYTLQGSISIDTLGSAWLALLAQNTIMRTTFLATGSRQVPVVQVVYKYQPELVTMVTDEGQLKSHIQGVGEGPFVSLQAIRSSKNHWLLKLRLHHALYDGLSLPIMMESLRQLCQGLQLEDQPQAHNGWKKWLSFQVSETTQLTRKAFWTEYLQDVKISPPQRLTASSSPVSTRTALFERSAINDTKQLQSICAASGVSLQALFFAAYAKWLARNANPRHDVVFGVYLANRTSMEGLDRLTYPTLSLVPLRVRQPTSLDILSTAKNIQADVYKVSSPANTSVGLWEIFDWTGLQIDSFVNFLSVPEVLTNMGANDVTLAERSEDDIEMQSQRSVGPPPDAYGFLTGNAVRDAYPDAVDIEVSVTGNYSMNIGVFGPTSRIDTVEAKELVSGIVDVLMGTHDAV